MRLSNQILQIKLKPTSTAKGINAKCVANMERIGCTPNHLEKGFKESISSCSSYSCPLYELRPYQAEKYLNSQKNAV